ncbi:hypothetical protein FRC11_004577 [Ceratobasidium sp. 423]|nr:hypothetical protein FRC11_004577 [Ceratobasidium sp. 423]
MPLIFQGIIAWVVDSEGKELPEYNVKLVADSQIECWIPSTEGTNFNIRWRVPYFNPQSSCELAVCPFLDGVRMRGTVWNTANLLYGLVGELGAHQIGPSTARLYEFGRRILTDGTILFKLPDKEDALKLSDAQLNYLNTIAATFAWGVQGELQLSEYRTPEELPPINEKSVKNGHSGSAGLGKTIERSQMAPYSCNFYSLIGLKPTTFVFRYAPRDWLQARGIIPYSPRPSPNPQIKPKRKRSFSSDVIDTDDLHTDDEGAFAAKRPVPAPIAARKKQRTVKREAGVKSEVQDD